MKKSQRAKTIDKKRAEEILESFRRCAKDLDIPLQDALQSAMTGAWATAGYAVEHGISIEQALKSKPGVVAKWGARNYPQSLPKPGTDKDPPRRNRAKRRGR